MGFFTELALKAIKNKSEKEKRLYVAPTKKELTEAIESIKRDQFIEDLYKRENEEDVARKLEAFYKSKGENYTKTPLEIDVEQFNGKTVYGDWTIDLNQVGTDDWLKDKNLNIIDLDLIVNKKGDLKAPEEEEGIIPPNPSFKITFRKAFQYIANKINKCCTQSNLPRVAIINDGSGSGIGTVLSNIDFIPKNPLTGKGGMSWGEAIFFLLKQEGYVFEVRKRGGSLFLQV